MYIALITTYTLLGLLLTPLLPILFLYRLFIGKENMGNIFNRFGFFKKVKGGETYWIHCASVGESISAMPLILKILKEKDINIIMTSITLTSGNLIRKKIKEYNISNKVTHVYFPYDHIIISHIFLSLLRPSYIIFVDSEIWPITLRISRFFTRNIYLVNARLSPRSFKKWLYVKNGFTKILSNFKMIYTSSKADYDRYTSFSSNVEEFINIKYHTQESKPSQTLIPTLETIKSLAGSKKIITIGSTHEGEEVAILNELKNNNDILIILAPRHPSRLDIIIEIVKKLNIKYELRSKIHFDTNTKCLIVDTIGELSHFYTISDVAIVCGSFVPNIGGHNPIEAVSRSVPVIMGKYHQNCTDIVRDLQKKECLIVSEISDINSNIEKLILHDKDKMNSCINLYQNIIEELYGKIFQENII
jgi:3-deoxy-D-manno-octulosonic-acid transferase